MGDPSNPKKRRKHGFQLPLHPRQIASGFVFAFLVVGGFLAIATIPWGKVRVALYTVHAAVSATTLFMNAYTT